MALRCTASARSRPLARMRARVSLHHWEGNGGLSRHSLSLLMKQANHSSGDFLLPFFDGCAVAHGPFQQILLRHAFRLMAQQIRGNLLRDSAFVLRNRLECSAQRVTARGQSRLTVSDLCAAGEDQILRLARRRQRERVADCRCQRDYNVIGSLGVADGLPCLEPSREVFYGHTLLLATFRVHFDGSRWDVHFRLGKVTLGAPLVQSTDDPGAMVRGCGAAALHNIAVPILDCVGPFRHIGEGPSAPFRQHQLLAERADIFGPTWRLAASPMPLRSSAKLAALMNGAKSAP